MTGKIIISIFDSIPLWVMILPILVSSIISLAIIIERFLFYRRINFDYRLLVNSVRDKVRAGRLADAGAMLDSYSGPIIEMMTRFVKDGGVTDDREGLVADLAEKGVRNVERFGGVISTIATVSPMLGLLGTVTGMMKSFSSLASMGPSAQDLLAQGITEALITTALGLLVAIPSIMFYNYMVSRSELFTREIEFVANSLVEMQEVKE